MQSKKRGVWSLRSRLMLFLCLASAFVLGLVWLFVTQLMQPLYNHYIYQQLSRQVDVLVNMIESSEEPISTRAFLFSNAQPNAEFWEQVNQAAAQGQLNFSNVCIDVADSTQQYVNGVDTLHPCLLHTEKSSSNPFKSTQETEKNGELIRALRAKVAQDGEFHGTLGTTTRQMVVGRVAHNGDYDDYTVIFSTNLARIEEAGLVLGQLMPLIFLCLMGFSVLAAWLFSRWFTDPLTKLSKATRQLAQGDYSVRVDVDQTDEIGLLAQDFNYMAREINRASQLQRDLLANVSHDLRTPLTLIKGYAETVRDLTGDDPVKRSAQLDVIVDETDRLSSLVNSVMELSKMSSGTDKPERVEFDMAQLCDEVAQRYEAVCAKDGCTLQLELPDTNKEYKVYADPAMMERVLHNLLGNAMHHRGEDGVFVLRLLEAAPGTVRIEVEDHGPGISKEDLPYIFDRYYRSRSNAGKEGTGLGLSITKAILQSHGFRFGVESTLGQGTCFWFEATDCKK